MTSRYWPDDTAARQLDAHLRRLHWRGWAVVTRTARTAVITRNAWPLPLWADILLGLATVTLWMLPAAIGRTLGRRHTRTRTVSVTPTGELETVAYARL